MPTAGYANRREMKSDTSARTQSNAQCIAQGVLTPVSISPIIDTNAAINILNLGKQARDGQSQSNANGLLTSTLLGESLVEQVSRLKLESQYLQT